MKKSTKLFSSLTAAAMLFTVTPTSFASTNDFDNTATSGTLDVNDPSVEVSEVLTFDEIVEAISKDSNISKKEAADHIISTFKQSNSNSMQSLSTSEASAQAAAATYRTLTSSFAVDNVYKPALNFYCQTSEYGSFRGIVKILNVDMNRKTSYMSKTFNGTVFTHLENANSIFWIVNGDFYNNGTISVNTGVSIGVGSSATVNFGVSGNISHYGYVYKEGRHNF